MTVVKEINPDPAFPANITGVNGQTFYTARAADGGTNLVVLTATGAKALKEFNTSASYFGAPDVSQLKAVGSKLFFSANGGDGQKLWTTDGTMAGTKEVVSLSGNTAGTNPNHLTVVAGKLYYTAYDDLAPTPPNDEQVLFETDGTAAGTHPVPGSAALGLTVFGASSLANFNGKLYFASNNRLWSTNGTAAGTTLVKTFGVPAVNYPTPISSLTVAGSSLFLVADNDAGEPALWSTDGTGGGTKVLTSAAGLTGANPPGIITGLTRVGPKLFFTVNKPSDGPALWVSDGTVTGTTKLKAVPGPIGGYDGYPSVIGNQTAVGTRLFFTTTSGSGTTGIALWVSNGTAAGTAKVADISPAVEDSGKRIVPGQFAGFNGNLYFANYGAATGVELWKSNGTAAGTALLKDINPGLGRSFPAHMNVVNGALYFSASDGKGGNQLWKTSGTAAGTVKVRTLATTATSDALQSNVNQGTSFATIGDTMLFAANNGVFGTELWKTDGTTAGTKLVKDLLPGPLSSYPAMLTAVGSKVFFAATYQNHSELWVSDGTGPGTIPLTQLAGPIVAMIPFNGGVALFDDAGSSSEIFVSNGTVGGTLPVTTLNGPPIYGAGNLTAFQGKLYFAGPTGLGGNEVFSSDGTTGGTAPFDAAAGISNPTDFTVFNGKLYFTDAVGALWASDGTDAGTHREMTPLWQNGTVSALTPAGTSLLFFVHVPGAGESSTVSLWKFDAASAAGSQVFDFGDDVVSSAPPAVLPNGKIVFEVNTITNGDATGNEPWVSDGTPTGTKVLKDVATAFVYAPPRAINDRVYFSAYDNAHGNELWQTDGTPAGTMLVQDVAPGPVSSFPTPLVSLKGNLIIAANNTLSGFELMTSGNPNPQPPTIAPIGNKSITAGNTLSFKVTATDSFPGTPLTYSLAPGAPAGAAIDATSGLFTWNPANPTTAHITVRVSDNSSPPLTTTQTFTVTVHGAKPVISAGGNTTMTFGSLLSRAGSFVIPAYETVTATVAYGDGSGFKPLSLTAAKTFTLSHTYTNVGKFTVLIKMKDQFGDLGTASFVVTVTSGY